MTKLFQKILLGLLLCGVPLSAFAHATPISYDPESSATLTAVPASISITFSEHLEQGASALKVTGPSGNVVSDGDPIISRSDTRMLSVPIRDDGKGSYLVSWSVVSSDDGHFTKGAYYFGVGAPPPVSADPSSEFTVVESSNVPEAFGMTAELLGHGIIWALMLLYIFAARPLLNTGSYPNESRKISSWYIVLFSIALGMVFTGGAFQLIVKAQSLLVIHGGGLWDALRIYIGTTAGSATLWRMVAAAVAGIILFFGRRSIFASAKVTPYEWGMIAAMCVFAFFRAKISHAAANPFFPDFSIAVNFVHLIDKDIWAGITLILVLLSLVKSMKSFFMELIPRVFGILAVVFASVSVTATYIVWLHLKSFANLFTTEWGEVFLKLFIAASLLVSVRAYHVFARRFRTGWFFRGISATLAIECALAILVVFYSSVIIITSPPLSDSVQKVFSAHDQNVSVSLAKNPYEDATALLTVAGNGTGIPVVTVKDNSSGDDAISIDVTKQFDGGYAMPLGVFAGHGPFAVSVIVPQNAGYDAHAAFEVHKGDFDSAPEGARTFDSFTFSMIGIGMFALLFAFFMRRFAHAPISEPGIKPFAPEFSVITLLLSVLFVVSAAINALDVAGLLNPFKASCVGDGNEWHLMVPMRAGEVLSETPREGCMWGMGASMYMFPTKEEYDFYGSFPKAEVVLKTNPETITAGVPVRLNVTLREPDGTPALLFVDMDKLLHMVIVNRDQSVFAHIHADDNRPLTREEIADSSFNLEYTFPKAGDYLVAIDYAHGLRLESKQFVIHVTGSPLQSSESKTYPAEGTFEGYDIALKSDLPIAGQVTTLRFTLTKDGVPVTDIEPYLSAASHIANVKNDFSAFIHAHGEVHPPGTPYPPLIIKDGQVVHSMAAMVVPAQFGPTVEAHLIYPTAGLYTVWAQFKIGGKVIPASFTVRVE